MLTPLPNSQQDARPVGVAEELVAWGHGAACAGCAEWPSMPQEWMPAFGWPSPRLPHEPGWRGPVPAGGGCTACADTAKPAVRHYQLGLCCITPAVSASLSPTCLFLACFLLHNSAMPEADGAVACSCWSCGKYKSSCNQFCD